MDNEELREHIRSSTARGRAETRRLTALIVGRCWPGGAEDRSERAAIGWMQRWRPERLGARLPACSCSTGRCMVCN